MAVSPMPDPAGSASEPESGPLADYYRDRPLLRRNLAALLTCNLGWSMVFTVVAPLMVLRMNEAGIGAGALGLIGSINFWLVAVLVMYFSWRSDHTVSRFGRRTPYLFISAPFIIATVALFPWFAAPLTLIVLYAVQLLFMDMKASTFVLLPIDCVPRRELGRFNALFAIMAGLLGFLALRYGVDFGSGNSWVPFVGGAAVMACTTLVAFAIREPPVVNPATGPWRPWTTLQIGWSDRRRIVLMLAVGCIHGFMIMYNTWIWLFACNELGMDRGAVGQCLSWSLLLGVVMAFPVGWVVDRLGSMPVVVALWLMQGVAFAWSWSIHDPGTLIVAAVLMGLTSPLYAGADIMVFRSAPIRDMGSVTASNSFTRNLMVGAMVFLSGRLIEANGNDYRLAFILGFAASCLGLVLFLTYLWLGVRQRRSALTTPVDQPCLASGH